MHILTWAFYSFCSVASSWSSFPLVLNSADIHNLFYLPDLFYYYLCPGSMCPHRQRKLLHPPHWRAYKSLWKGKAQFRLQLSTNIRQASYHQLSILTIIIKIIFSSITITMSSIHMASQWPVTIQRPSSRTIVRHRCTIVVIIWKEKGLHRNPMIVKQMNFVIHLVAIMVLVVRTRRHPSHEEQRVESQETMIR